MLLEIKNRIRTTLGENAKLRKEWKLPEALWKETGHNIHKEPVGGNQAAMEKADETNRRAGAATEVSLPRGQAGG